MNDKTPDNSFPTPVGMYKTKEGLLKNNRTCSCGKINEQMDDCGDCNKKVETEQTKPQFVGWLCPVCGRGNSPFSAVCPCKGWDNTITC